MERTPRPELEPETVAAFAATFLSRWDCYPKQLPTGKYTRINHALSLQHVYDHLYGLANMTLGAYALDTDSRAKWLCFDADDETQFNGLRQAVFTLAQVGQSSYLERSRRGGHLWLFFSTPLAGYDVRRFAQQLSSEIGIEPDTEVYPKQNHLLDDGYGSLVRLPFGIHQKTYQRYHFVTLDGQPIAPTIRDQIRLLAAPDTLSSAIIEDVLSRAAAPQIQIPTRIFTPVEARFDVPLSEAVKGSMSVFEVVSRYVSLNDKHIGLCPFHDDHEYSFGVDIERNYWHCFAGCGGGSIIDFWMRWRSKNGQDGAFTPSLLELREMLIQPPKRKKKRTT